MIENQTNVSIDSDATSAQELTADQKADRAWRAAVLGIVVFPLLLYAIFLVVEICKEDLSPSATRKFHGTLLILGFASLVFLILFRFIG